MSVPGACVFLPLFPAPDKESSTCLGVPGSQQNSGQWTVVSTENGGAKTTFPSRLAGRSWRREHALEGALKGGEGSWSSHWYQCWRDGPQGLPSLYLARPPSYKRRLWPGPRCVSSPCPEALCFIFLIALWLYSSANEGRGGTTKVFGSVGGVFSASLMYSLS